jgi:ATP-dependent exoDNAse (exonuclease V) beta subunit
VSLEPRGTKSQLQVTFRCDAAIIAFVNRIFPSVLDGSGGQCAFVPLVPRKDAGPGQVVRWDCPDEPEQAADGKISAAQRARHEARFVAERIRELGPQGLGASDWSQVAILCPRKNWLLEIQRELVDLGVPVQLHSSNEQQRDRTPAVWLTALIWVAAHPEDSFEIAGVLREILGVSDSDMALFTRGDGDRLRLDTPPIAGVGPVESAFENLREACARVNSLPLNEAVQQLVEKTHLRQRLNSIAELKLENAERELDDFLALITARSAEGTTLAALAEELRLGLGQVHPAEEEIRDAVQMMTSHKAKGLEWQAVIVPFVFRTIESKATAYPRVVLMEGAQEIVCRDKVDYASQAQAYVTSRERQQHQRLLYVMATRAKRSLVLVDDEMLFAGAKKRAGASAGELLGLFGEENRGTWKALPETCSLPALQATIETPTPVPAETPAILTRQDIRRAQERAARFPRRITPHALARHTHADAEPEVRIEREDDQPPISADNPGILYGTWWHEFVQTIPWQEPGPAWQRKFDDALAHSPQKERSTREWDLFRQSRLAQWLAAPGRLVQVETPFLWQSSGDGALLEGVMDLAVYAEDEALWHVIDWKTNHLGATGSTGLVEIYRGQIEAYVQAMREMLSVEVRGSLYLTETGEWIPFEP